MFRDKNVIRVVLEREEEVKLHYLSSAMAASKMFGKSKYAMFRFFMKGGQTERICKLLAYCLS